MFIQTINDNETVLVIEGTPGNDIFNDNGIFGEADIGVGGHDIALIPVSFTDGTSADTYSGQVFPNVSIGPGLKGTIVIFEAPTIDEATPEYASLGVEEVQFGDGKTFFIENADNANIARLYSAAFDRVPDAQGLFFWEDVYANNVSAAAKNAGYYVALAQTNDGSGVTIADGFMQSSEFTIRYGTLTDSAFVNALYQNVLGRGADQAGLNFWTDQLSHGTTRAMVLVGFAESPENVAKSAAWLIAPGEPTITTIAGTITSSATAGMLPTTVVTGNDATGGLIFAPGPGSTNFGDQTAQPGFWSVLAGSNLDLTQSGTFGTSIDQTTIPGFVTGNAGDVIDLTVQSWVQTSGGGGIPPILGLVNASLTPVVGAPFGTTTSDAIIETVTSGSTIGASGNTGADVIAITDATFANAAALAKALASGSYKLFLAPTVAARTSFDIILAYSDGTSVHIADVNMFAGGRVAHPAGSALSVDAMAVHVSDMVELTGVTSVTSLNTHNIHFLA